MRQFTKEHNDLNWLFPNILTKEGQPTEYGEDSFESYEQLANTLFDECYENQKEFTKDDMIDAFMKGASVAHQTLVCEHSTLIEVLKTQVELCKILNE